MGFLGAVCTGNITALPYSVASNSDLSREKLSFPVHDGLHSTVDPSLRLFKEAS
jgi:hypothetical protein